MRYSVEYTTQAVNALKKLDSQTRRLILAWIEKNLVGCENSCCENPRIHGKGLTSNHSSEWRYRVGDYRIIADISEEKVIILVLRIGHRSDIY